MHDEDEEDGETTCNAETCKKLNTIDEWDSTECEYCPNIECCEECCA